MKKLTIAEITTEAIKAQNRKDMRSFDYWSIKLQKAISRQAADQAAVKAEAEKLIALAKEADAEEKAAIKADHDATITKMVNDAWHRNYDKICVRAKELDIVEHAKYERKVRIDLSLTAEVTKAVRDAGTDVEAIRDILIAETEDVNKNKKPIFVKNEDISFTYAQKSVFEDLFGKNKMVLVATDLKATRFGLKAFNKEANILEKEVSDLANAWTEYLQNVGIVYNGHKYFMAMHSGSQVKKFFAGFVREDIKAKFDELVTNPTLSASNKVRVTGLYSRGHNNILFHIDSDRTLVVPSKKITVSAGSNRITKVLENLTLVDETGKQITQNFADGFTVVRSSKVEDAALAYHGAMVQAYACNKLVFKSEVMVVSDDVWDKLIELYAQKEIKDVFGRTIDIKNINCITSLDAIKNDFMYGYDQFEEFADGKAIYEFSNEETDPSLCKTVSLSRQLCNRWGAINCNLEEIVRFGIEDLESFNTEEGYLNAAARIPGKTGVLASVSPEFAFSACWKKVKEMRESAREKFLGGKIPTQGTMLYGIPDFVAFFQSALGYCKEIKDEKGNIVLTGKTIDGNDIGYLKENQYWCNINKTKEAAIVRYPNLLDGGKVMQNAAATADDFMFEVYGGITGIVFNCRDYNVAAMGGDYDGDEYQILTDRSVVDAVRKNTELFGITVIEDRTHSGKLTANQIITAGWTTDSIGIFSDMLMYCVCKYINEENTTKKQKIFEDSYKIAALAQWYVDAWKHGFPHFEGNAQCEFDRLIQTYMGKHPFSQKFKKSFFFNKKTGSLEFHDGASYWMHEKIKTDMLGNDFCDQILKYVTGNHNASDIIHRCEMTDLGYTEEAITSGLVSIIDETCDATGIMSYDLMIGNQQFDYDCFKHSKLTGDSLWDKLKQFNDCIPVNAQVTDILKKVGIEYSSNKKTLVYFVKDLWRLNIQANIAENEMFNEDEAHEPLKEETMTALQNALRQFALSVCIKKYGPNEAKKNANVALSILADYLAYTVFSGEDDGFAKFEVKNEEGSRNGFTNFVFDLVGGIWAANYKANKEANKEVIN